MHTTKTILRLLLLVIMLMVVVVYLCNRKIENAAKGKLYSDTETVPFNNVGLLLGTAKYLGGDFVNPYYAYRIQAAIALLRSGKINYIIVSGDNGRTDYNEPQLMRADLMEAGMDSTRIHPDYAGFRTFDSMVRLREIFDQDSVTIISQPFHNERAIYIASQEGITAIGFNAQDVSKEAGFRVQLREKLARVKVFVD